MYITISPADLVSVSEITCAVLHSSREDSTTRTFVFRISCTPGWPQTSCVAKDDLGFLMALAPPPERWDYRHNPQCPLYMRRESRASHMLCSTLPAEPRPTLRWAAHLTEKSSSLLSLGWGIVIIWVLFHHSSCTNQTYLFICHHGFFLCLHKPYFLKCQLLKWMGPREKEEITFAI